MSALSAAIGTARAPKLALSVTLLVQTLAALTLSVPSVVAPVMAADLGRQPHSGLMVQLCGDAHLLNFGFYGSPERQLLFGINDFDETHPGPFEWDVQRLAASFVLAAHSLGLSEKQQSRICRQLARVLVQVFVRAELARVDEDRHGHVCRALTGLADQGQVAFVQGAHGGNQGKRPIGLQLGNGIA